MLNGSEKRIQRILKKTSLLLYKPVAYKFFAGDEPRALVSVEVNQTQARAAMLTAYHQVKAPETSIHITD
jgi:hypothetical protein